MDTHTLEDTRPFPEGKRKLEQVELIHESMREHRMCQLAHTYAMGMNKP